MATTTQQLVAADVMTRRLVTLNPDTDVFKAVDMLVKYKISGAPVVDEEGRLLGMFTEKSCLEVLIDAAYEGLPTAKVAHFMGDPLDTIEETTSLLRMAQIFLNKKTRRLPVLREDKLVGQVSRRDLMRAASKMVKHSPDRESTLLYLSALTPMKDHPAV